MDPAALRAFQDILGKRDSLSLPSDVRKRIEQNNKTNRYRTSHSNHEGDKKQNSNVGASLSLKKTRGAQHLTLARERLLQQLAVRMEHAGKEEALEAKCQTERDQKKG